MVNHHKQRTARVLAITVIMMISMAATTVVAATESQSQRGFTAEQRNKYANSRVLYAADATSATVVERQFQGGLAGGAAAWRQHSITHALGDAPAYRLGPGSWVGHPYLSPWYVYQPESLQTYFTAANIWYLFEYFECRATEPDVAFRILTECYCWTIGSTGTWRVHEIAPLGASQ